MKKAGKLVILEKKLLIVIYLMFFFIMIHDIPKIYPQTNGNILQYQRIIINNNDNGFWKFDLGNIISSIAAVIAAIGLLFTGLSYRKQVKTSQTQIIENFAKDITNIEAELNSLDKFYQDDRIKMRSLRIRELNSIEWFAFLINSNKMYDKPVLGHMKPLIKKAYESLDNDEKKQLTELVTLYNKIIDK